MRWILACTETQDMDKKVSDLRMVVHILKNKCAGERVGELLALVISMYDGVSCDSISLGFVVGAPTAVAAILWLLNLGWILRGSAKPLPTEAELAQLYEELQGVLVKKPLRPTPAAAAQDQQQQQKPQAVCTKAVALSFQWTHGLGAVIVLVRRPA